MHSGRHFLQIPGPTNVPDRVLRAMDRPTIDQGALSGVEMASAAGVKHNPGGAPAAMEYLTDAPQDGAKIAA